MNTPIGNQDYFKNSGEKIIVTDYAKRKLKSIAKIMEYSEFRAISISERGQLSNVIQDFYIPKQEVTPSHAHHQGTDLGNDYSYLVGLGKIVLGIAHGHGNFGTFHSPTDNNGFDSVLNSSWTHNKIEEYLDFEFGDAKITNEGDYLTITAFNGIDMQVRLPKSNYEKTDLKELKTTLKGRILKRIKGEVSSLVVNQYEDRIYGIKRIREHVFMMLPNEKLVYSGIQKDPRTNFSYDDGLMKYSIEAEVQSIDIGKEKEIDLDNIVQELKTKIKFLTYDIPRAFRKKQILIPVKEQIVRNPIDYKIEIASNKLITYVVKGEYYSQWLYDLIVNLSNQSTIPQFNDTLPELYTSFKYIQLDQTNKKRATELLKESFKKNDANDLVLKFIQEVYIIKSIRQISDIIGEYVPSIINEREKEIIKQQDERKHRLPRIIGKPPHKETQDNIKKKKTEDHNQICVEEKNDESERANEIKQGQQPFDYNSIINQPDLDQILLFYYSNKIQT